MDYNKLRKYAVQLDLLCLLVGGATLYVAYNCVVPQWILYLGAALAFLLLLLAMACAAKARRCYKATNNEQGSMTKNENSEEQ